MDGIEKYEIILDKQYYKSGDIVSGFVTISTNQNFKIASIDMVLKGKAHVEWRVTRGGERRTIKGDEVLVENVQTLFGVSSNKEIYKETETTTESSALETVTCPQQQKLNKKVLKIYNDSATQVLLKGDHKFPFEFQLPTKSLPCSFESRLGSIRYFLRVVIDIPYRSPPQALKYFTVIGPSLDCFDDQFTIPLTFSKQSRPRWFGCCSGKGPVSLEATLERKAYCCGEKMKAKCQVFNGGNHDLLLFCQLHQEIQYKINKADSMVSKEIRHIVLEHPNILVKKNSRRIFFDFFQSLLIPTMPPSLGGSSKIIDIRYFLKMGLCSEKIDEDLVLIFPITITSEPHRTINNHIPLLNYGPADDHVEGGIYISPEFLLGQVYDGINSEGTKTEKEAIILYRPSYISVKNKLDQD